MAKSSKDVGVYGRALFVCAVMGVVPENEILKQLMIEAWNDLKKTPVGVVFNAPPDEWGGISAKGWEVIKLLPMEEVVTPKILTA